MDLPHTKQTTGTTLSAPSAKGPSDAIDFVSLTKMQQLLTRAAQVAGAAGVPPEAFAGLALQSYLRSSPEVAERIAEAQFEAAVEELRASGRLAKA